jgi:hypothetical protein
MRVDFIRQRLLCAICVGGITVKSKVLATAAIISLLCCGNAKAQWPLQTYGNQNRWEVEVGTRLLDRPTKANTQDIVLVTEAPTNVTVFTGKDASDLDISPGVDFRFLKQTNYDTSWEVRGFFNDWDNYELRTGNLRTPFFSPDFLPFGSRPDRFEYSNDSDVFSLELTCKKAVHPGLMVMCGPRYVSVREQVLADINYINANLPGFQFGLGFDNQTNNYMPGWVFGLEVRRPLIRDIFFSGGAKGTILANFVSTETVSTGTVIGGTPVSTLLFEDSTSHAAGILELNARLHYDISPGHVSLYAGYEAFWLDGVAVSPIQVYEALGEAPELNTSTTTFVHGLSLGLMCRF